MLFEILPANAPDQKMPMPTDDIFALLADIVINYVVITGLTYRYGIFPSKQIRVCA
jgi:hypothetical protein